MFTWSFQLKPVFWGFFTSFCSQTCCCALTWTSLEVNCLAFMNFWVMLDAGCGCCGSRLAGMRGSAGTGFFLAFSLEKATELRVRGGDTLNWLRS